ncbi:hypothetical protein JZ751_024244 [Albula glossodonta]|uniref:AMOP domain-containing protein n=1 Tax=Albula glossodonta TaxID=121402 RepID=A0A8T2NFL1_9TELE|nr:hypothetical protein JZ751_024244 [Albula glossodonta]
MVLNGRLRNINVERSSSSSSSSRQAVPNLPGITSTLQRDGPGSAFVLDLNNFPDLAKANMNRQNPNIQVTIEVVDGLEGAEPEQELQKEGKPDWGLPNWRNWWSRTPPPVAGGSRNGDGILDDSNFLKPEVRQRGGFKSKTPTEYGCLACAFPHHCENHLRRHANDRLISGGAGQGPSGTSNMWPQSTPQRGTAGHSPPPPPPHPSHPTSHVSVSAADYIDGEGDWSSWSACSVTCGNGNQKRTRSCGYACTATESRTCDMPACPGIEDAFRTAATEVSLLAGTDEFNATELFGVDTDSCERWMNCKSEFLKKYLLKVSSDLPSCPCSYPTEVAYSTADVHDPATRRDFRWKDASGPKERLEIYKPTARYCIRSMLTLQSTTLAAQHCCYDDSMRLITRGKGAGSPNLISTEFSEDLHYKVDILPWVFCKGDWSRYNQARPPNNGRNCEENPSDEDYNKQFEEAREF